MNFKVDDSHPQRLHLFEEYGQERLILFRPFRVLFSIHQTLSEHIKSSGKDRPLIDAKVAVFKLHLAPVDISRDRPVAPFFQTGQCLVKNLHGTC